MGRLTNLWRRIWNPSDSHQEFNNGSSDFLVQGFQKLVVDYKVPGIAVSIYHQNQLRLQHGFGWANISTQKKIYPDTSIFRIASISKCITGVALAKMVEEGIIDLDADFRAYVPYYPKKEYDFTIRQLAGHTAGIRSYKGKEYALNKPYTLKDSLKIFAEDPLIFEPGKGYHYNSFDFVLLSLAMQEASGIAFETYVQENILNPLGMNSTFSNPENLKKKHTDLVTFYSRNNLGFRPAVDVNNLYKLAGGGYLSTAQDIAVLGQALLKGHSALPNLEEVLKCQQVNGQSTFYGLGFQVSQDTKGRPFYGHIGNSVGAYSNLFVFPETQTVISILVNCTDPKIQEDLDALIEVVLQEKN